jgi:hypothetical protein
MAREYTCDLLIVSVSRSMSTQNYLWEGGEHAYVLACTREHAMQRQILDILDILEFTADSELLDACPLSGQ